MIIPSSIDVTPVPSEEFSVNSENMVYHFSYV